MNLPELYSALADPTRLKVLDLLHEKSRPVHELAAAFDISRPAISRHLRVLKEAGLVKEVKQGRENVYTFQRAPLKAGAAWIEKRSSKSGKAKSKPEIMATAEPASQPTAKPKDVAAKPAPTPKVAPKVVAPPPASAPAPQLSFFDI
jgi:DNA-binding transcriptional ArsR family regulator